jgi:hypothetical protein
MSLGRFRALLRRGRCLLPTLLVCLFITTAHAQNADQSTNTYACGGKLEADVWRRWDDAGISYAYGELIARRLIESGDTYALYDFEIVFHNLLAMAQRCYRSARQVQLLTLVAVPYGQLVPAPGNQPGRAWICWGGRICNGTNRLINTEVMLTSVQFLAFATSLAQGIDQRRMSDLARNFVHQTTIVALEHLTRWSALPQRVALRKRIAATPADIRDGSSALFLTDKDLWQMVIYADLAGMLAREPQLMKLAGFNGAVPPSLQEHFLLLLRLFAARTSTQAVVDQQRGEILKLADLDAGFWRLYADSRYAGYTGSARPVVCNPKSDAPNTFELVSRIDPASIAPIPTLGWDISHARRLVHFFEAIDRNRSAVIKVFGLMPGDLPSREIMSAFAGQLRIRIWNQDKVKPLFANYFNGANGWYRVAYDNGTGRCQPGHPPYGLTDAFPTGGYATWAALDHGLGGLGERIYELTQSNHEDDQGFVNTYYPSLGTKARADVRVVAEFMFWPTLVGN